MITFYYILHKYFTLGEFAYSFLITREEYHFFPLGDVISFACFFFHFYGTYFLMKDENSLFL